MKVSRVKEMQAMDRRAIQEFGIRDELLMENAGRAAFHMIWKEMGIRDRRFVLVCGTGNNGGDGLVVARLILSGGGHPAVILLGEGSGYKGAARINFDIVRRLPIPLYTFSGS